MNEILQQTLQKVESVYPGLSETARLVLSVVGSTRLKRTLPLSVILIGQPSSGKSSLLTPLTRGKAGSQASKGILRLDEFTPASLVSHASKKLESELKKSDLLPRLKGKCVVIKEMAPTFSGHEDDLTKRFSLLASILDGDGHVSSSGNHGIRGYEEKIVFSIAGAVAPKVLSPKVMDCMSTIGPRICFWEMPERSCSFGNWKAPTENKTQLELEIQDALLHFTEDLFSRYAEGSLPVTDFSFPTSIRKNLESIALMKASLRSSIYYTKSDLDESRALEVSTEGPERGFQYLEQIVMASALIDGRSEIGLVDLKLALGVAIGSAKHDRRKMMRMFFDSPDPRSSQDFQVCTSASAETVKKRLDHLQGLGLVERVSDERIYLYDLVAPLRAVREALVEPRVNFGLLRRLPSQETPFVEAIHQQSKFFDGG